MATVVLGVTGGIAAFKSVELLRLLREAGLDVTVVPTQAALRFVGEPTWSALSGRPIATDVWHDAHDVPHVRIGQGADVVVIAPATADFLARAAHGIASDLLTNVLLTAHCPVIIAPAMHTEMWQHPATAANVATLRSRGVIVLEPSEGRLTGADSGPGRLPEPRQIADVVSDVLRDAARVRHDASSPAPRGRTRPSLSGVRVVVSVGGTREPWDDVRFLGNRSSGKQGFAVARAALARGAQVTAVVGHVDEPAPAGCSVISATTAEEMRTTMHDVILEVEPQVVVMAAAVADFRPVGGTGGKISKESLGPDPAAVPTLPLARTTDILAELVAKRGSAPAPLIVGFAAETPGLGEDLIGRARVKLERKGCDVIVANSVASGAVFGEDRTSIVIVQASGQSREVSGVDKLEAGFALWDTLTPIIPADR
jgi:phosphopantothenoylcysteine decarboxylase/phosphopantothenate--cysteine ligase